MKSIIAASLLFFAALVTAFAQDPGWPRQITKPQGTLVYYQPQVDNWNDFVNLDWQQHPSSPSASSAYHPSSSETQGMQQEAQNRDRGEQSSQRYSEQRSSGGWGHSGGGGGRGGGGRR